MGISRAEAYEALQCPIGADGETVKAHFKKLAMKWYPDKHKNSPESIKNFLELSMAFKRLNIESDIVQMSLGDCLQLFQQTFSAPKQVYSNSNGYNLSDDEESEEDDEDEDDDYDLLIHGNYNVADLDNPDGRVPKTLTPEEIEKNANELIIEEEKEKRRAEKRRAKKKRRREKKRQEKVGTQKQEDEPKKKPNKKDTGADTKSKKQDKNKSDSEESEAEDFDRSAAFFTQVVNKKKKGPTVSETSVKPKPEISKTSNGDETSLEDLDPVVLRSRQLAIEGNKMANMGHYQAAIDLFTEAVKLDPRDFRFFGNRSYCFDRMQQYEKALKDADKAIYLAPDWPKGYFRKGRALAGLKLYADAEQAFMQVLKLDRNCEDAMSELLRVRTHQLTEMGFSQQQAQNAIRQYDTVQQALDSLLAGVVAETSLAAEVYMSDEDDYSAGTSTHPHLPSRAPSIPHPPLGTESNLHQPIQHKTNDAKMDPKNPEGLTALWVGNVLPEVNEKKLNSMFSKYGQVTSVRLLPEKYCAFINFKTKEGAGNAMKNLQGMPCVGQQLLIKFPDNPLANGHIAAAAAAGSTVIRKGGAGLSTIKTSTKVQQPQPGAVAVATAAAAAAAIVVPPQLLGPGGAKQSGPVNGDECYFWRTTGCHYGDECHYKHMPDHKGLDRKPWQKNENE